MAVTNTYFTDASIRRAVYIERLKTGQRVEYDKVLAIIIPKIQAVLLRHNVERISDLSTRQIERLLRDINAELDRISQSFVKRLMTWLKAFAHDQKDWNEQVMERTVEDDGGFPFVPYTYTDQLVFAGYLGSTGMNIKDSLDALITTQKQHLAKKIKIGYSQSQTMTDVVRNVIGTKSAKHRDGLFGQLRNFGHEVVGSVIQYAANSTNLAFLDKYQDYVTGYMWVSVLDGKTSATCRSLDGQVFRMGEGPVPPAHPHCRSHITAVFGNDVGFLKGLTRKAASGSIDAGVTYYSWLKTQTAAFQDSVLGKSRGKLFRSGGMTSEEFGRLNVGRNFEQLTLEELRKLHPEMFEAAGL